MLTLIPTHLPSHNDRFRASFVCRHWRRTFLQHAGLWSELFVSKGEDYVKTLLERAKGTALDVFVGNSVLFSAVQPLSTRTKQIRRLSLDFFADEWETFQKFSELASGPLPLLHTLTIDVSSNPNPEFFENPSSLQPVFSNAVNLKVFCLYSKTKWSPSFTPLTFPNLVSFDFLVTPLDKFPALQLLDFLEASPMLRTVHMTIMADILFEGIPQRRIVILPNVESFNLTTSDDRFGYEIAIHISCPSVTFTSLTLRKTLDSAVPEQLFPAQALWDAIICQYTRSLVEEVAVETMPIASTLTFRSADATVIKFCFEIVDEDPDRIHFTSEEILVQATRAVQHHPQLANIKCLRICYSFISLITPEASEIANEVELLFKSVGPLDELTICSFDLELYFPWCFSLDDEKPVVFPPTKKLTISQPPYALTEQCVAIVELAMLRHTLGIPFEQVIFCGKRMSAEMEERLRTWVGSVEYHKEPHHNTALMS